MVLITGVITGGIAVAVMYFQGEGEDRRLKTRLEDEAKRRREAQLLAVRLEPIEHVGEVINAAIEAFPGFVSRAVECSKSNDDDFDQLMAIRRKAEVSMTAIGNVDALVKLDDVRLILVKMLEAGNSSEVVDQNNPLISALAGLETFYKQMKSEAISDQTKKEPEANSEEITNQIQEETDA